MTKRKIPDLQMCDEFDLVILDDRIDGDLCEQFKARVISCYYSLTERVIGFQVVQPKLSKLHHVLSLMNSQGVQRMDVILQEFGPYDVVGSVGEMIEHLSALDRVRDPETDLSAPKYHQCRIRFNKLELIDKEVDVDRVAFAPRLITG